MAVSIALGVKFSLCFRLLRIGDVGLFSSSSMAKVLLEMSAFLDNESFFPALIVFFVDTASSLPMLTPLSLRVLSLATVALIMCAL